MFDHGERVDLVIGFEKAVQGRWTRYPVLRLQWSGGQACKEYPPAAVWQAPARHPSCTTRWRAMGMCRCSMVLTIMTMPDTAE
jgi:hypothetical protein